MSSNKMSSPNQSLTNGDLLLASPASNSNQSQLNKSTNRPLKLRRVNHKDEIVFGFSSLLRNESMTDVTLICNGGQTIRAHRVILSTFSPYFRAIFEAQPFSNNPCQYPVIVIKDLELNELKTIIDFIYKGEVSVSRDKLQSVLQAAKALEVSGLADLKSDAFGVNSNAQTNSVNTLLANSLMNSPNTVNQSNLNDLNFGSLSALNYVCNLNNKRDNNSLNNSLDNDLFNENQLNRLRVSIEDSSELLNTLNTSLLGDNTVNIDGVRSLLQQPPRLPQAQALQQLKQQQLNQLNQMKSQRQLQLLQQQQRQQLQRIQQHQQNRQLQQQQQQQNRQLQQQILQLNQNGNLKNKYSVPKNSLQGQNLVQFQEKIKQQIQEKQQQQQQQKSENTNGNDKSNSKDQDVEEIVDSNDMNENGDDKLMDQNDQNDLIVDDENNNQINKLNEDGQLDDNKNSDDKNDDLENGANGYVDYDESADPSQLNGDDEEYEIDINKDQFFQRQQQIRLEQLKNQQHFQQLQLLQVDDPENRSDFQKQLFQAVGLRNANDLNGDALNGRRNSSKDSLLQTSSASGSEDTDNDNNNDNTMDINDNLGDNLSIMENNFFDDYNNLTSGSPIPMQVKLSPQLNRIPQTPDFLLPRGPGRPRKGNKGSDISPCPECHKKFVRPDVLKLHYRSVHLLERHPCNMCEKVFKWPGDLSKHKRKSCKGRNLVV